MSGTFDILQKRYQDLLLRREEGGEEYRADVRAFIADARRAGVSLTDPDERGQVRAWMRYLAFLLADGANGEADISLRPPLRAGVGEAAPVPPPAGPRLFWVLTGGVLSVVLAIGFVLLTRLASVPAGGPPPTATPRLTPSPRPFVARMAVRTPEGLDGDVFCRDVAALVAEVEVAGIAPGALWHWEVRGGEGVVNEQPPLPWGDDGQVAVQVLPKGQGPVAPGRYEWLVYVEGQLVGRRSFTVLETGPRLFDLRVSDMPGGDGVEAASRVLYLGYGYVGLCPGVEVVHTLYRGEAALVSEREVWNGPPDGTEQVVFPSPDARPFPSGEYRAVVEVAGEERAVLGFSLPAGEETLPSFGEVTVALGVRPDGTPLLTAPDNRFDWNTKIVYAVFDYVGMEDGLRWGVAWARDGREVAREERRWDLERDGATGTYWVTFARPDGYPLPGGDYTVTLSIGGVSRRTAGFYIRFYVPEQQ